MWLPINGRALFGSELLQHSTGDVYVGYWASWLLRARVEMDAEAEEREDELREAYAHVKQLQEAARVAAS